MRAERKISCRARARLTNPRGRELGRLKPASQAWAGINDNPALSN